MNVNPVSSAVTPSKGSTPAEKIDHVRLQEVEDPEEFASSASSPKIQPEELLKQIKALTDEGLYSVRFENDDLHNLVVKVVDRDTDEVIRQIPTEELMELTRHLKELTGNFVDTMR
ncbi:MAG: flagellar protein FlaG [Thermodesulfobacteriota bacterium]